MEFQVSVKTAKGAAEACAAVESALAERKFSVLWHLHVNEKLQEKGLALGPDVHILEVCSAPKAKLAIETNPEVAYFLPCKIVVRSESGQTQIGLARPTMLMAVLGDERLEGLAREVEATLLEVVEVAAAAR
jgi:uncharacterized protein (DUF302 family)